MLEQADLRPGTTVLEIGSGGLNAALIAEVVGPHGRVVSVDIDPKVTDLTRALLRLAGYADQITVRTGDGWHGRARPSSRAWWRGSLVGDTLSGFTRGFVFADVAAFVAAALTPGRSPGQDAVEPGGRPAAVADAGDWGGRPEDRRSSSSVETGGGLD